jgi:hypothetical protein
VEAGSGQPIAGGSVTVRRGGDDDNGRQPRLLFMHFWANDNALKLARGLRTALDVTKSRRAASR